MASYLWWTEDGPQVVRGSVEAVSLNGREPADVVVVDRGGVRPADPTTARAVRFRPSVQTWLGMYRGGAAHGVCVAVTEAEAEALAAPAATPARTAALAALTGLGVSGPGGLYKPDAEPADPGPCEVCGRAGLWVSGAGRHLCVAHQDSY